MTSAILTEAGLAVLKPVCEDLPFDLVIWFDQKFFRLQVKRAQLKPSGSFEIPFRKTTHNSVRSHVYKYTLDHADFIVGVVVPTSDFYFIPMAVVDLYRGSVWVNPVRKSKFAPKPKVDIEQFRNAITLNGKYFQLAPSHNASAPALKAECR